MATTPRVFGKYEVIEKIGEGGFGTVYRGRDPQLKRFVAIKTCGSELRELRDRFFREAEIAANLQHPNVTTVFDFGDQDGVPYLVQEFLSGEDLHQKIRRRDPLDDRTKLGYMTQIAEGLRYAHAHGVIHRDIKPANIRVLDGGQVKIMDFGIAKLLTAENQLTQTGITMGTAGYLPPEQIRGEPVDHRADIFSFGVLSYELLTYRRPFEGDSLSTVLYRITHVEPEPIERVWTGCPPRLAACVSRCLSKDPAQRYPDFAAVLEDLRQLSAAIPTVQPKSGAENLTRTVAYDPDAAASGGVRRPASASGGPGAKSGGSPQPSFLSRAYATLHLRRGWPIWAAAAAVAAVILVVALGGVRRAAEPAAVTTEGRTAAETGAGTQTGGVAPSAGTGAGTPTGGVAPSAGTGAAAPPAAPQPAARPTAVPGAANPAAAPTGAAPPSVTPSGSAPPAAALGGNPPPAVAPPGPTPLAGAAPGAGRSNPIQPAPAPPSQGARERAPEPPASVAAAPAAVAPAAAAVAAPPARVVNPRFLVLIQGDPDAAEAAEATFVDEVRNSGFRVVDAGRTADLRRNEAEMAEVTGAGAGRIKAIGQQYGAEVVVLGKLQSEAEPGVGRFFTGRAVLALRTFEADTGEYLGAKTLQVGGGGTAGKMGPSAMVAKSSAAEEVARLGAAAAVEQVRSRQQAGERQLMIIVYGAGSAAEARQVQSLLQSLQGVRGVDQTSFAAGKRLELAAEYGGDPQRLGERLDGQRIGGRQLKLTAAEKGRLTLELR